MESRPLPDWLATARPGLEQYADLLATVGVERGLIGPREVERIWTRHILNCAVVADPRISLVPQQVSVADVGSGAGLPGLVWAIARPDLRVTLIEPLLRRTTFLSETVDALSLGDRVEVARGRAEEGQAPTFDVVTARAVAPMERLLPWTVPLIAVGGRLVALKGSSAADEVAATVDLACSLGMSSLEVVGCGAGVVDPPTTVVVGSRIR